jgi:hypothetical protein
MTQKTQKTQKTMRNRTHVGALAAIGLAAAALLHPASAAEDSIPFAEAELFFELNDTDGDLGIHSSIDGEGWTRLTIEDPSERTILDIEVRGRLRQQSLTQLFFESAEPPFDELAPGVFFRRFPAGVYEISAVTLEGGEMESEAVLTHAMPAPPSNIRVNGYLLPDDCDADPGPQVDASGNIFITWDPVDTTHEEIGSPRGSTDIEIVLYQIFLEQDDFALAVDHGPADTELLIPPGLLDPGAVKVEILAREESHNQTATETCFVVP